MPESWERHTLTSAGRVRSRTLGRQVPSVPDVVVVQGMAVADYLMPALAQLGRWTRAHLLELPGYAGSGEATRPLDVSGYGDTVVEWLEQASLGPVVLVGHSSGTQVAARAAVAARRHGRAEVAGLVLASPTLAPSSRPLPRLLVRWRQDSRHEPPGLHDSHVREWRRAGVRGIVHLVRVHLKDRIEESVSALDVPCLVLRGADDRLSERSWAEELASRAGGRYAEMPGAHTFVWQDPSAWSEPIRDLASQTAAIRAR
jgi:pimeloyl-ACP methyl ester carboxylesterase